MQVMMQVSFYGHVRQYKNIQAEIDANLKRVLESGEYVQGPMLKQFEQDRLLDVFTLNRAVTEIANEIVYRPEMAIVPLRAVLAMLAEPGEGKQP